jgi:hypothetical protein
LVEGSLLLGVGTADIQGKWSITSSTLADGIHNIAAQAVDGAGNVGPVSLALTVTIDTLHPTVAVFAPRLIGDTDSDFDCDLQDLLNVLNNFGKSGLGDTNDDGIVDAQDRDNVVNHLRETAALTNSFDAVAQFAFSTAISPPPAAAQVGSEFATSTTAFYLIAPVDPLAVSPDIIAASKATAYRPPSGLQMAARTIINRPAAVADASLGDDNLENMSTGSARLISGPTTHATVFETEAAQIIDRYFERTQQERPAKTQLSSWSDPDVLDEFVMDDYYEHLSLAVAE